MAHPPVRPGPPSAGRWLSAVAAFLAAVVCAGTAAVAWSYAHVTYALPHGEGHDVLGGGIVASVVAMVATIVSLVVGILAVTGRWRRPTAAVVVAAGCLVLSVVALVLFQSSPHPSY